MRLSSGAAPALAPRKPQPGAFHFQATAPRLCSSRISVSIGVRLCLLVSRGTFQDVLGRPVRGCYRPAPGPHEAAEEGRAQSGWPFEVEDVDLTLAAPGTGRTRRQRPSFLNSHRAIEADERGARCGHRSRGRNQLQASIVVTMKRNASPMRLRSVQPSAPETRPRPRSPRDEREPSSEVR